jgi:hypothetical protein
MHLYYKFYIISKHYPDKVRNSERPYRLESRLLRIGVSILECSSICQLYFLQWHIATIFLILTETSDYEAILHKQSARC